MNYLKRALAAGLCLCLCLTAGCSAPASSSSGSAAGSGSAAPALDLSTVTDPCLYASGLSSDTVVATAGDVEITAGDFLYWACSYADQYMEYLYYTGYSQLPWDIQVTEDATLAQAIAQDSLRMAYVMLLLPQKAQQAGVTLPEETEQEIQDSLQAMADDMGSQELADHYLWASMLNRDLYLDMCRRQQCGALLKDSLFGQGGSRYADDSQVLQYMEDELGYYRFKHILFMTVDPEQPITREDGSYGFASLDEDTVAQKLRQAQDTLAQLQAAGDLTAEFDALMQQLSEDTGLEAYPDGYTTYPGEMDAAVEQAALALEPGELSGLVEGSYGYHILLRLPLEMDESYREGYNSQMMTDLQMEWADAAGITTNEAFDQLDVAACYDALSRLRESVQQELSAAVENEQITSGAASSAQG